MKLKKVEDKKNKLVVEVEGEGHTFLNLLRENCWEAGAEQASYMMEHPKLSEPQITVRGKNPKKILKKASKITEKQAKEMKKKLNKKLK